MIVEQATINTASGSAVLVPAVTGQYGYLLSCLIAFASSTTANVKDGASTLTGDMTASQLILDWRGLRERPIPWFNSSQATALNLILGGTIQCSGRVYYTHSISPDGPI